MKTKKLLSFLLAAFMLLQITPAFAAETTYTRPAFVSIDAKKFGYGSSDYSKAAETVVGPNADVAVHLSVTDGSINDFSSAVSLYDETAAAAVSVTKTFVKKTEPLNISDEGGVITAAVNGGYAIPSGTMKDVKVVLTPDAPLIVGHTYRVDIDEAEIEALNPGVDVRADAQRGSDTVRKFSVAAHGTRIEENFNNTTLTYDSEEDSGWTFAYEQAAGTNTYSAVVVTDDTNNFLRLTQSGSNRNEKTISTYEWRLSEPFVLDMAGKTVIEMKVRNNGQNATNFVKINYPHLGDGTQTYARYGAQDISQNHRILSYIKPSQIIVQGRDQESASQVQGGVWNSLSLTTTNNWYTIKSVINNAHGTTCNYIYDAEGNLLLTSAQEHQVQPWWFNYATRNLLRPQKMHTIDKLTFQTRPDSGVTLNNATFDIDDIKIYNEALDEEEENFYAAFKTDYEYTKEVEIGDVVYPEFRFYSEEASASSFAISAMYVGGNLEDVHVIPLTNKRIFTDEEGFIVPDTEESVEIRAYLFDSSLKLVPMGRYYKAYK